MESCTTQLDAFGIEHEVKVLSAHRDPAGVMEWATTAASRGIK
ncbi:MAG: AIR carboxylase family protein, partial [Candidatus Dormibacteraeota bacterium]|nr:AIR carboxylase family protein [Candidatus Dormibacteraeota bacterium]